MMNKGTAVVGFILCFLAGMALMYGVDHSRKGFDLTSDSSSSGGAWSDNDSPIPVDSKDPVAATPDHKKALMGELARATSLTPEQRAEIAKKAAKK